MKSTAIKGAAGEFYVASYLSALGLVVALPRCGVPSSDLLVTTFDCNKTISLQVKTASNAFNRSNKYENYLTWPISIKSKSISEPSHWYVFVNLMGWPNEISSPDIYFVSSIDVANIFKTDWNKDGESRLFFPIFTKISNANKMYINGKNDADFYKGIKGAQNMLSNLKHSQQSGQPDC